MAAPRVAAGAGDVHGHGDFGGDGGPATAALLSAPSDIAFDGTGNAYIADTGNNRVRKIDASGTISTVAGGSVAGADGDSGAATSAHLSAPIALAVGAAGALYIADSGNLKVRVIDAGGTIITTAASGSFASVADLLELNDTSRCSSPTRSVKRCGSSLAAASAKPSARRLVVKHMTSADGTPAQTLFTAGDGKIYQNAAAPTPFAGNRTAAGATGLVVRGVGRAADRRLVHRTARWR